MSAAERAKPTASLSLDLDNHWSYLKTHGDASWQAYPSYLNTLAPVVCDLLAAHGFHITVFVVGEDAVREENRAALRAFAEAGHEFGNHSFVHEPWMSGYDAERVREELLRTDEAVRAATEKAPVGFRGPGFCYSPTLLKVVHELGYSFDASLLPSFVGPMARLYYLARARLDTTEREKRSNLFGRFSDGFAPLRPFAWDLAESSLLEIPVTTIPVVRAPFHLSYLIWLSRFSTGLAAAYFRVALGMCRLFRVEPSILLHPLDFLGCEDAPDLAFFPGMDLPRQAKLDFSGRMFSELARRFDVVPMSEHARRIAARKLRRRPLPQMP